MHKTTSRERFQLITWQKFTTTNKPHADFLATRLKNGILKKKDLTGRYQPSADYRSRGGNFKMCGNECWLITGRSV